MDEKMYTNAAEFNPDRFMVKDPPKDPRLFTFGVGRRSVIAYIFSRVLMNCFAPPDLC